MSQKNLSKDLCKTSLGTPDELQRNSQGPLWNLQETVKEFTYNFKDTPNKLTENPDSASDSNRGVTQCAEWTLNKIDRNFHWELRGVKEHVTEVQNMFCLKY